MAAVRSLGLHSPVGLPYLIAEGYLPEEPAESLYSWETYDDQDQVEEVLYTERCVVWARGSVVKKAYSFDAENEPVKHAVLTWFPVEDIVGQYPELGSSHSPKRSNGQKDGHSTGVLSQHAPGDNQVLGRALVVFLNRQAHIHFLSGATHLIHLHFEVDRVFPTPRGLFIERKVTSESEARPITPVLPKAPPNSFLSPFAPRLGKVQLASHASDDVDSSGLDFDLLRRGKPSTKDDLPRHFCLTSPLAEVGLVVHSPRKSLSSSLSHSQRQDEVTALGPHEEILYASRTSELTQTDKSQADGLILVVTANKDRQVYTIWQALYADSKSATILFKDRSAAPTTAKTRRRSSFITRTGATTPALRQDEGLLDSFTLKKRSKKHSTLNASQSTAVSEVEADDLLASQLDLEFESRHPAKASRRVSSMLSRTELSTNQDRSAFQELASQIHHRQSFGPQGRRGQSFGGPADRTSFGIGSRRLLRSSTPGAFSRLSLDDMSESGTITNFDGYDPMVTNDIDDIDDIFLKHAELDSFDFRLPFDGLRREALFHLITEIPMSESLPLRYSFGSISQSSVSRSRSFHYAEANAIKLRSSIKIFTIESQETSSGTNSNGRRFFLHIMNREAKEHIQVEMSIQLQRRPLPELGTVSSANQRPEMTTIPMAIAKKIVRLKGQSDAIKIQDGEIARVVCLRNKGEGSTLQLYAPWSPETAYTVSLDRLRIFNPFEIASTPTSSPRNVGRQRTLLDIKPLAELSHSGPRGVVSLRDVNGSLHRVQLHLSPRNERVASLLQVLLFVLPTWLGDYLLCIWWNRLHTLSDIHKEWQALLSTIFLMTLALEDNDVGRRKSEVSAPKPSPVKSRKASTSLQEAFTLMLQREAEWNSGSCDQNPGWRWTTLPVELKTKQHNPVQNLIIGTREFLRSKVGQDISSPLRANPELVRLALARIVGTLHLYREEAKLDNVAGSQDNSTIDTLDLAVVITQVARWMSWEAWDWSDGHYYATECAMQSGLEDLSIRACSGLAHPLASLEPPSFHAWLERAIAPGSAVPFPSLDVVLNVPLSPHLRSACERFFPRITAVTKYLLVLHAPDLAPEKQIEAIAESDISSQMLETLPEVVVAVLKNAIIHCQAAPPTSWSPRLLDLVQRDDLSLLASGGQPQQQETVVRYTNLTGRDAQSVTQAAESSALGATTVSDYSERLWISRLIFFYDRRIIEAMHLIEPLRVAVASCPHDPAWSEQQMLDAQKDVIQWVMTRTFALAPGYGMAHFNSRHLLLTEKFVIHGYNMTCKMMPMGNVVQADKSTLSEDKYGWSWFHAGVAAGLSISRHARGIDTSWIIFNRPPELTNRHAGLLLALGLNGHLKSVARWLCFKYLTPKHTMTSIGLLLGLSASHVGTMDPLVTRLLSVHITRMLPPGAAELNLSPLTQTAGLIGIGLLYCETQHRRMSEVMLSEIENMEMIDPAETSVNVRDESYRLAAGFALGFINLGKGGDTRGLNDMRVVERLLAVAVGSRPVELVHILDQATAAATVAIALIYLKTGNKTVARKVDVPDTLPQFDYVRPDVLLLRTLAKHLILWDEISADDKWIKRNLPRAYASFHAMRDINTLKSEHMPFYYILAGLLWSIALKHAGSGNEKVSNFLVGYLDRFIRICRLPAHRYDAKLARNTIRNCQDLLALACATVMSGTGDLIVMRRLRLLHGRTNADTPYGSHLAAHMALGALFLGAGTYTFSTSNLAIASLICAFYPLFPVDVTDNKAHLQPLRHLWVLAAEARCIIIREVDTNRPQRVPITLKLRDGTVQSLVAPCLLPELDTISSLETSGTEYWPIVLDLANNPSHLASFKLHQTIYVRKRPPGATAATTTFSATFLALNDVHSTTLYGARKLFRSVFELPAFRSAVGVGLEDLSIVLPLDWRSSVWRDGKGSVVDAKLMLRRDAKVSMSRDALWNLRVLFKFMDLLEERGTGGVGWLGTEVVKEVRGIIEERSRRLGAVEEAD